MQIFNDMSEKKRGPKQPTQRWCTHTYLINNPMSNFLSLIPRSNHFSSIYKKVMWFFIHQQEGYYELVMVLTNVHYLFIHGNLCAVAGLPSPPSIISHPSIISPIKLWYINDKWLTSTRILQLNRACVNLFIIGTSGKHPHPKI